MKFNLYKSITKEAKKIEVFYFTTRQEAEAYAKKLKKWTTKEVTRGRSEKGCYNGTWALVCCK